MADPPFELPRKIERCLASLSRLYAQDGKRLFQQLIVNAQIRIEEGFTYNNWDGGIHGHALYLVVPETLYLAAAKQRDDIRSQIAEDINQIHNVKGEFVAEVFLEMDLREDRDWRQESGLLVTGARPVSSDAVKRLWEDDSFRLFLSHKATAKLEVAKLKGALKLYGISAFVAHEDIEPTKAWQSEIENALATMDGFVALMTQDFHESDWTDQEVGYALARGVPVVAVRLGTDPYGFLGKFQALSSTWDNAAEDLISLLIKNERMVRSYINAMRLCSNYEWANKLSKVLPSINVLNDHQIDQMIDAYNENTQLRDSYGFDGSHPSYYGPGLIHHLHRLGRRRYLLSPRAKRIEPDF